MTTTDEVPMPEPSFTVYWHPYRCEYVINPGRPDGKPGYTADQLRAYADARCEKLQAEHALAVAGWADGARLAEGRLQAMTAERDEAWAAYHDCQEVAIRLKCEADTAKLERDALAEKVKAMEDNDRRYRWLRDLQCCSMTVSKNDGHAPNYMSLAEWIECSPDLYDDVPPEELELMKDSGTDWAIQVYPKTPVGFNDWRAATLDAAIDAAGGDQC